MKAKLFTVSLLVILVLGILSKPALANSNLSPQPVVWSATCVSGSEIIVEVTNPNVYQGHLEIRLDGVELVDAFPDGGSTTAYILPLNDQGYARVHNVSLDFWAYELHQSESVQKTCEVGWARACEDFGLVTLASEADWVNDIQLGFPPYEKTFTAPNGATHVLGNFGWQDRQSASGEPQTNEGHKDKSPYWDIAVPDLGEDDNDLTFWYATDLSVLGISSTFTATVEHFGDSSSQGSHWSHTKVSFCTEEAPALEYVYLPLLFKQP